MAKGISLCTQRKAYNMYVLQNKVLFPTHEPAKTHIYLTLANKFQSMYDDSDQHQGQGHLLQMSSKSSHKSPQHNGDIQDICSCRMYKFVTWNFNFWTTRRCTRNAFSFLKTCYWVSYETLWTPYHCKSRSERLWYNFGCVIGHSIHQVWFWRTYNCSCHSLSRTPLERTHCLEHDLDPCPGLRDLNPCPGLVNNNCNACSFFYQRVIPEIIVNLFETA